ncbi:hypothetical protein OIO90_002884 [Microbotryomycetes sp. JL221]|nr:hypothetical protein OIO90_002884 [Microbotryomycetes sp. JL221]
MTPVVETPIAGPARQTRARSTNKATKASEDLNALFEGEDDTDNEIESEHAEDDDYVDSENGRSRDFGERRRSQGARSNSSGSPDPSRLGTARKIACTECYRRKITCSGIYIDNTFRCSNCVKLGILCQPRERSRAVSGEKKRPVLNGLQAITGEPDGDQAQQMDNVLNVGLAPEERRISSAIKYVPPPRIVRRIGELSPHAAWATVSDFFASGGWLLPLKQIPPEFSFEYLSQGRHQTIVCELIFAATVAHAARWSFSKAVTQSRISTTKEIQSAASDQRNHLTLTREKRLGIMRDKAFTMSKLSGIAEQPKFDHLCALFMMYELESTIRWNEGRLATLVNIHGQIAALKEEAHKLTPVEREFLDYASYQFLLWDAQGSISLQRPLLAKDEIVALTYSWSIAKVQEAYRVFADIREQRKRSTLELQRAIADVVIHCLRLLAQDPFDLTLSSNEGVSQVTTASWTELSDLSSLLISVEAALTNHVEKIGHHVIEMTRLGHIHYMTLQFDAKAMIDRAQMAFLMSLKVDLQFSANDELSSNPFSPRQRANTRRLNTYEMYGRYLETALVGATHDGIVKSQRLQYDQVAKGARSNSVLIPPQTLEAEFVLASVEFDQASVEQLCSALGAGAWFSSFASERATALAQALVQTNLLRPVEMDVNEVGA